MFPDFQVLGINLYSICMSLGLTFALLFVDRVGVKKGFSLALQRGLLVAAVVAMGGGLFFATLFQSFYHWLETGTFVWKGMTFYGGFVGGAAVFLALWFFVLGRFCKDKKEPIKQFPIIADAAAVAVGRSKAEAIVSVCMHHPHRLLVTDEGAALRMMEILRV
jgi:prolipoprotein diacylglyceryltransferase